MKKWRLGDHPSRSENPGEKRKRLRGVRAWLLEWQSTKAKPCVVGVLPPRWKAERVVEIAKAIFVAARMDPGEMRLFMRRGWDSPLTPMWAEIEGGLHGVTRMARFTLGGHPRLCARIVENLREPNPGTLSWDELPIPGTLNPSD